MYYIDIIIISVILGGPIFKKISSTAQSLIPGSVACPWCNCWRASSVEIIFPSIYCHIKKKAVSAPPFSGTLW